MEINSFDYKILIVDDVMSNVLLLKVLLTNEKYRIATAGNGTEALAQVQAESPDLILLDVMMPDMDGFEVARHLKSSPYAAEIPIIFLSALSSTSDIVRGFQVGANDYISKPFNKEELLIRIRHQITQIEAKRMIVAQIEELKQTIIERDNLYSVIAHNLRSPMGSIKMVLNMLILNLPGKRRGAKTQELLSLANQTTDDVFALLDNLLKWTESKIGKINVIYQDVDLVEVAEDVIERFGVVAKLKMIEIKLQAPEKLEANADIDMIKTIIQNLLGNAIKFSNKGSEILVKVEAGKGLASVSVQDYGCGIDEENQKKLLHTDTHYSTFGTNNEKGSGLGLLLVQDFVHKNGGELWFTSGKDKGSTFGFNLPISKDNPLKLK